MMANVETLGITYFKLDFDFSTDIIFAHSYCSQFILFDVSKNHVYHRYLRTHDEAHKRLWFLWSGECTNIKPIGRCGCIGGCAFFGNNRNGAKFFKPSFKDFQDGINMAAFR
jgi:hypothetical protein